MGLHVIIPVAGAGTRLRPHTHTRPKALVPVAGKPILGHILDDLGKYPIDEIALVVGPDGGNGIRSYVTRCYPQHKFRFVVQSEPRGLGHAIWVTADAYRKLEGQLLIVLGDTIFEANFDAIVGAPGNWIAVKAVDDPRRFGVIVPEGDHIKSMVEKPEVPPSNLAIVGIYALERGRELYASLDEIVEKKVTTRGEIQLTDALQNMIARGAIMKPFSIESWYDCGKPDTLLETNRSLLNRKGAGLRHPEFPGCVINSPVAIAADARIENSIIGPNVSIGEGSVVTDSIVNDSIIAERAEVSKSLLTGSIIADHAKVAGRFDRLNIGDHSDLQIG